MTQEPKIFPYIARLLQGAEVVWKPLGEVATFRRGSFPQPYTKSEWYGGDNSMPFVQVADMEDNKFNLVSITKQRISQLAMPKSVFVPEGTILVSLQGTIGRVAITQYDSYVDRTIAIFTHIDNEVDIRYFAYQLKRIFGIKKENARGSTIKTITKEEFGTFQIPLPPLSVQQEIVRILDKFTQLEAELEAELDCRKRQYEYYRNNLLSYEENEVEWKTLGEVFTLRNGYTPSKSNNDFWENGTIPWFRMEDIRANGRVLNDAIQKVSKSAVKGGKLFPANSIMLSTTATIGEHALIQVDYLSNQQLTNFSLTEDFSHQVDIKYVFHYFFLINEELKRIGSDATLQIIGIKKLEKIKIPIPPLEEQQRITSILDKFDTLVNSISEGLPKEIALRRKQYEYYREKLLSFPKK
jgi:restriction modification system DNA specificity domain protein